MQADRVLDISGETCPMTFVRTKLALEKMSAGQLLLVRLREGEPMVNVPNAVRDHGHAIRRCECIADGLFELVIEVAR